MTPRTYTQDRRAASAADTRRRIQSAAFDLYREHGIASTTILAIARRADVARGTVLHHFGSAEGLLEAILDDVVTGLEYPDEHLQDGVADEPERIRRYVDAMFRFFVRSEDSWPAFSHDMDHPVLKTREAEYYGIVGRLYAATFPGLAGDRVLAAAVRAYVNYAPLNDLRAGGLNLDEAIEVVAGSMIDLAGRRRARQTRVKVQRRRTSHSTAGGKE